ncbi:tyrosine-type recombinase/integrase [Marinovum algicola]|uniref:tyrosine-type recombinase/integrase n=1 Tax=Marinovum algicola TaxID=42444 RepID=UPI0032EBD6D5
MTKLTNRSVAAIKPSDRDLFVWDDKLPGFGLRVKPSGVKSYIIQYRNAHNETRRMTIGRHGVVAPDRAREKARKLLQEAHDGTDPARQREEARKAPSLAELADHYLERHAIPKKRPRSVASDKTLLGLHILPTLGSRKVASITRADIANLHHSMQETPGAANRTLALLSKMMNLAEKWEWRPDGSNPCRHIEKYPENKVERFLSPDELAALGIVLARSEREGSEMLSAIAAIRLLIFTGARLGEILALRWEDIDFDRQCFHLKESKTGKKTIYLNAPALEVLHRIERTGEWVIAGKPPTPGTDNAAFLAPVETNRPLVNLRKPWHRIRERATVQHWSIDTDAAPVIEALSERLGRPPTVNEIRQEAERMGRPLRRGLQDVRLHDLRHSFASVGVAGGLSLPMIGALLGHTQTATTARYSHLADDPLRQANDMIGERISAALRGHSAQVVEIGTRKR